MSTLEKHASVNDDLKALSGLVCILFRVRALLTVNGKIKISVKGASAHKLHGIGQIKNGKRNTGQRWNSNTVFCPTFCGNWQTDFPTEQSNPIFTDLG